jgi:hypothetical protein
MEVYQRSPVEHDPDMVKTRDQRRRFRSSARGADLPASYGKTRVVLLAVHPCLVYAYWEVTEADRRKARKLLGKKFATARAVLRFRDFTPVARENEWMHQPFDVEIDLGAGQWYVHLWSPERIYQADLGFRTAAGDLLVLATSDTVATPRAWPSPRVAEPVSHRVEPVHPPSNGGSELARAEDSRAVVRGSSPVHAPDPVQRTLADMYQERHGLRPLAPLPPAAAHVVVPRVLLLTVETVTERCERRFAAQAPSSITHLASKGKEGTAGNE